MIKSYLKIAWRNLLRNKGYSFINIMGLATGMSVALLIGLWVFEQYSYDKFLPGYENLYQVKINFTSQHTGTRTQHAMSIPIADVLRNDIPGIKRVAEANWVGYQSHGLLVGDKKLYLEGGTAAPEFLKMFRFDFVSGNREDVMKDPFSIILTQTTAKALFGNVDPVNKIVKLDNTYNLKVTGVLKDLPANSSFQFAYLMPFSFDESIQSGVKAARTNWTNNSFQIFVELQPNADFKRVSALIKNIVAKHSQPMRAAKPELFLQPLAQWHLYSDFKNGKPAGGLVDYLYMFGIIGVLVLLIACINFMNLSTARSEKRAREIGVRKAIGSQKRDLVFQFLTESIVTTFIAFLLSMLILQLALPKFNTLTGSSITVPYGNPIFWLIIISFVLVTGAVAGSRPAFYLASFNPVKVLKGTIQTGKAAALPRQVLVVVQFSCSIVLIIGTLIIYQQIQYAKNRPTGYSSQRLVMTDMSDDLNKHYDALKNDLIETSTIENVAMASSPVTSIYSHTSINTWPGKDADEEAVNIATIYVSDSYFKTVQMKLLAGHDFEATWQQDTDNVILNEAAVQRMGLKRPVNQKITWNKHPGSQVRIIGVVKNALMGSPYSPIEPAIFAHARFGNAAIYRLNTNVNPHDAMAKISHVFDKYNPAYPFSYQFVDDEYEQKFKLEVLVGKLAGIFAGLAIFISCLGLFGLVTYIAEQRSKEISIRKVLGASISQLWLILSADFILLIVISCFIATPLAWYFLTNWLQKYDYRINIGAGAFLISGVVALSITLVTVSFQSIKAALANPINSLRSE